MPIIKAHKLTKKFERSSFDWKNFRFQKTENTAVNAIDLEINEGEFVGFLGPNGAGKTTFLKMLSGIIYPTSGKAEVLGYDPFEKDYKFLKQIGLVMGQKNQLWWDLSAKDSYDLLKEIYEIDETIFKKDLDLMIDILDMRKFINTRVRNMSLGERMKCEIVAALIHQPKLLFLDEPTIGLDIVSAQAIRKFLKEINQEKKCTIILTSHYMADVEALCERLVIINRGTKVYDGSLSNLRQKYASERIIEIFLPTLEDKEKFAHLPGKKSLNEGRGTIRIKKNEVGEVAKRAFENFDPENITISDVETEEIISKIFTSKN